MDLTESMMKRALVMIHQQAWPCGKAPCRLAVGWVLLGLIPLLWACEAVWFAREDRD